MKSDRARWFTNFVPAITPLSVGEHHRDGSAVPELTRNADIQLNNSISAQCRWGAV